MNELRDYWAAAVLSDRDLSLPCVRLAWALREYVNKNGRTTVSIGRLASDTDKGERWTKRLMARLAAGGYVQRVARAGVTGRGGTTARTDLLLPAAYVARTAGEQASPLPPSQIAKPVGNGSGAHAAAHTAPAPPEQLVDGLATARGMLSASYSVPYSDADIMKHARITAAQLAELKSSATS